MKFTLILCFMLFVGLFILSWIHVKTRKILKSRIENDRISFHNYEIIKIECTIKEYITCVLFKNCKQRLEHKARNQIMKEISKHNVIHYSTEINHSTGLLILRAKIFVCQPNNIKLENELF